MGDGTDTWRAYFQAAKCDIFEIIENGIRVAASDHPGEFRRRRGQMVEYMFSCRFCKCQGCEKCVNNSPVDDKETEKGVNMECRLEDGLEFEERSGKEADNADGASDEGNEMIKGQHGDEELDAGNKMDVNVDGTSDEGNEVNIGQDETNLSDAELDMFAKEIERNCLTDEVLEVKAVILDGHAKDYSIFESLKKLQSLDLSVSLLKETCIGKVVSPLRRHAAKEIRNLARALIQSWKQMVDARDHISKLESTGEEKTPDVSNDRQEDEADDPPASSNAPAFHQQFGYDEFPPVYEAAFLSGHPPMELSSILDDIDEQGNVTMSIEMSVTSGNKRKYAVQKQSLAELKPKSLGETDADANRSFQQKDKPVNFKLPSDPDSAGSATGKPARTHVSSICNKTKSCDKSEDSNSSKRPKVGVQNRAEPPNETADKVRFEAAKKKLLDGYVQAQKVRKRTVKMLDFQDLPKVRTDEKPESQRYWPKQKKYQNHLWKGGHVRR
uniref:TFIIS N-terminal domain-containing protein n=1 Tax=Kalanchoe fedtschenkoi TaxID=63787 RepID=A0A7N0VDH5_KALFE